MWATLGCMITSMSLLNSVIKDGGFIAKMAVVFFESGEIPS